MKSRLVEVLKERIKIKKFAEEELNQILEELRLARMEIEMMYHGIFDVSRSELDRIWLTKEYFLANFSFALVLWMWQKLI